MIENYSPTTDPYISVIHVDDNILILDKQSGLLTVPGKSDHLADCLESRAQEMFSDALIVHRLDMDTSGLVVLGRGQFSHRHLSLQFQNRNVDKSYVALVYGEMKEDSGEVDLPLICDWPNRPKQIVDIEKGKQSLTKWRVLERNTNYSRVLLTPITGRSHQLRVHMKEIGHPILGDRFYAHDHALNMKERLCLHAQSIRIMHPMKKIKISFESPAPF